jgi:ATP/maltotriose-dependent transcriptional regulator MalT
MDGIIRPFLDEAPLLKDALRSLVDDRYSFAAYVLECMGRLESGESEVLSRREIEVLDQIAQGKSNQDIADGLFISLGTVKWHVNNIFAKLSVGNRTAAIKEARDLGIIR